MAAPGEPTAYRFVQGRLDEAPEPAGTEPAGTEPAGMAELLRELTFCVVDLETTGTDPATTAITEIGAVRVRGGVVSGEFHTLVDPEVPIPPFISALTGITAATLAGAPRLPAVLPAFLEFARGTVLVAHNAPFDIGFLKAGCARLGYPWPGNRVLDTVVLARRILRRGEVPNVKLATLAQLFRAHHSPEHRALADARATVEVLHGLLDRVGALGVHTYPELIGYRGGEHERLRRKRHLAASVPHAPGVYLFRDGDGEPLYIGTSGDLRTRVNSYFTSGETRPRMAEMIQLAQRVDVVVCAHTLEARVRELRMIALYRPPYNRRSTQPRRGWWITLTQEPFPRLSLVRAAPAAGRLALGPFPARGAAAEAADALHEALPLRRCGGRLPLTPRADACALLEIGRCGGPCVGAETTQAYQEHVARLRAALASDLEPLVAPILHRIDRYAGDQRYEDAARLRDRLRHLLRAVEAHQRREALSRVGQLVAARPAQRGGWELALVRHGRLAGASVVPAGAAPLGYVEALLATAQSILPAGGGAPAGVPEAATGADPAGGAEEIACVEGWLAEPGTRLVRADQGWALPRSGGGRWRAWLDARHRRPGSPPFSGGTAGGTAAAAGAPATPPR